MRCPFGRAKPPKGWNGPHHFGTAWQFIEYVEEQDRLASEEYWTKYNEFHRKYPTCWDKFLNWIGWK
jgi:hypothetical protein